MRTYIDLSSVIDVEPEKSEVLELFSNEDIIYELLDRLDNSKKCLDGFVTSLKEDFPYTADKLKELL